MKTPPIIAERYTIRSQTTASLRVKGEVRKAQAAPEKVGQEKRQIRVLTA